MNIMNEYVNKHFKIFFALLRIMVAIWPCLIVTHALVSINNRQTRSPKILTAYNLTMSASNLNKWS